MSSKEWNIYRLCELTEKITKGTTPTTMGNSFVASGINFIKAESVLADGSIDSSKFVFIDAETHRKLKRSQIEENDILFSMAGMVLGKTAVVKKDLLPANTNQALAIIRLKKDLAMSQFIGYFMRQRHFFNYVNQSTGQSAQPNINLAEIGNLEISLPPLPIQHRISDILSALDDKIELNRQTNATLEAIAQAIFKEWFVDFNFPGATGEMVESELGMLPRGWEVKPLSEAIKVNPSRALRKGEIAPYLDMANMPTQGHRGVEWIDRPFGSGTRFINGDTLLARITPCLENGKTAFVDFLADGQTGWGSTEYIVLHPKAPLPPEYGYYLARFDDLRNHAIQNMSGTSGRQRTPASSLDNFLMVVPEEAVAKQFGVIAASIISQIRARDEESRTLAALRDTLLPKLMSGEIEV